MISSDEPDPDAAQPGPPDFDAVVIGAGISGLVSASILLQQGLIRVAVVDQYAGVGGNHLDFTIGGYTFDVGSLVFQDDSPLLRHFPELLDRYLPIQPSWAKLTPQGCITRYPFSVRDDLIGAGPVECARILLSVAFARMFGRRRRNAWDYARYWIGARLLRRSGLENYIERFCGLPAERIDLDFAEQRMHWIARNASVQEHVRRRLAGLRRPAVPKIKNRQLLRPREGFAHLYGPAVQRLTDSGATFLLGTQPKALRNVDGTFHLEMEDRAITARRVVSTIPLDRARELCGMSEGRRLPTITLVSLFFSFSGERGFWQSILYNFAHDGSWKRLTMYSDFYGRVDDREYFTVEVVGSHVPQFPEEAARDFRSHTAEHGLFTGDLHLEGSHALDNAYPVYTEGAADLAAETIAELRGRGVESLGRQGGFRYQATSRSTTLEAEAALQFG